MASPDETHPSRPPRLTAYSITPTKNDGAIWSRCGIAFQNPDGSISVKLDTLPLSGRIHLRDPQADKQLLAKHAEHRDSTMERTRENESGELMRGEEVAL